MKARRSIALYENKRYLAMPESYREEASLLMDLCGIRKWLKKPLQIAGPASPVYRDQDHSGYICEKCGYEDCVCSPVK